MDATHNSCRLSVLMLPWLAHGHTSAFLELAKRLAQRHFNIYICSSPANFRNFIEHLSLPSIHFVELHLPSFPELPPHFHTTNGLPPHLMPTLKIAFHQASPSFTKILQQTNPDLLIYDFIPPWAPALASSFNIPAIQFLSTSATRVAFSWHFCRNPGVGFPFPSVYLRDYEIRKFLLGFKSFDEADKVKQLECSERSSKILLVKSFREIEGKYMDYLSVLTKKKIVPVGPLVQDPDVPEQSSELIIKWLDEKKPSSAVFVSFGSEYFLSKHEIEEIAHGLELSELNFIWVIRFPKKDNLTSIDAALPEGFLERVMKETSRGIVVDGWAPQAKILQHPSIGGFVSHCGWNSVMESMKYGVPIIAMPMHLDQPINARLVAEVGIGLEVVRDENGRVEREAVAEVIRAVVVEKSGESLRLQAKRFGDDIQRKGDEEIDEVAKELMELCN